VRARATGKRPRVALIEWQEPLMAAGNWMPEMVSILGAENLFGRAGAHSPWMNFADLIAADPDAIVVAPCGYDLERTRREMHWLDRRPEWQHLRAVREGRVYLADGNQFFNRPGPRVVETLEILAEILFPDAFAPKFDGRGWERWSASRRTPQFPLPTT
jgi:iron complex transport system substrate-binding protein